MRVFLTRPQDEAAAWAQHLSSRQHEVIGLPLIAIASITDLAPVRLAWAHLANLRAVMFVSANAVRHFFACKPSGDSWPRQLRAWAPGSGTGAAWCEAGLPDALIDAPPEHAHRMDSEALWERVAGQVCAGECVLIVRGSDADASGADNSQGNGRDWLGQQLTRAAVLVTYLAVYERRLPDWTPEQMRAAAQGAHEGVWLFSSSQAIGNLLALLPGQSWAQARALATHPRIAQAARDAGFGVVCESRASRADVCAALESMQ